jgi:predicted nucleic acid-binding protein
MPYLLDSDVLIDISRNRPEAIDYVDTLPDPWMISQVTAMIDELTVAVPGY